MDCTPPKSKRAMKGTRGFSEQGDSSARHVLPSAHMSLGEDVLPDSQFYCTVILITSAYPPSPDSHWSTFLILRMLVGM